MAVTSLHAVFDAERDSPDLVDALSEVWPDVRVTLQALRREVPLASSCQSMYGARHYRLPYHYRAVSMPLGGVEIEGRVPPGPVTTFKGTEPLLPDFDDYLQWISKAHFRGHSLPMGHYFPLILKMPPAVVPLDECLREQRVSTAVQRGHLAAYGQLARTPVPLFVFALDQDRVLKYLDRLRELLPREAVERVESRVRGGLGIEVYFYGGPQVRVTDLLDRSPAMLLEVARLTPADVETIVDRWTTMFARFLQLGYVPYASWNAGWGSPNDPGNACIDGGFADLTTLVALETLTDEGQFRASVAQSIGIFCRTVVMFGAIVGRMPPNDFAEHLETVRDCYVVPRLQRALEQEAHGRSPIHPWLQTSLRPDSLDSLLRILASSRDHEQIYPGPESDRRDVSEDDVFDLSYRP